jgi:hypothetical protein
LDYKSAFSIVEHSIIASFSDLSPSQFFTPNPTGSPAFTATMASLRDFNIQIATIDDADELVQTFKDATNDGIYDILGDHYAATFRYLMHNNCGVFQVARLKGDVDGPIAGLALFKLRFGGWRDPEAQFSATSQHRDLHAKLFMTGRPLLNEASGDPVFTQFQVSLEAGMQTFSEAEEDVLSKLKQHPPRLFRDCSLLS